MIILTAALDLVGPNVPKGIVLLCNVVPSFVVKLLCPYWVQTIPYPIRILSLATISILGMLLIVTSPVYDELHPTDNAIATKMIGVSLASASSGGGEVTFLGLTHFYGPFSLAGWGSGTGGAGLIGAGAYALATTGMGLGSRTTLFASAFLPFAMVGSFFLVLPLKVLKREKTRDDMARDVRDARSNRQRAVSDMEDSRGTSEEGEEEDEEEETLLHTSTTSLLPADRPIKSRTPPTTLSNHLHQMRSLFIP